MPLNLEGLELARERGDQFQEQNFIFNLVWTQMDLGDWDAALRQAAIHGEGEPLPWLRGPLPWLLVQRRELADARRILETLTPLAVREGVQSRSLEAWARAVVLRAEGRKHEHAPTTAQAGVPMSKDPARVAHELRFVVRTPARTHELRIAERTSLRDALQPGRGPEPLEDLPRLVEQRLRVVAAALTGQPLTKLQQGDGHVERLRELAKDLRGLNQ
jgi:hypothetical protein